MAEELGLTHVFLIIKSSRFQEREKCEMNVTNFNNVLQENEAIFSIFLKWQLLELLNNHLLNTNDLSRKMNNNQANYTNYANDSRMLSV